MTLPQMNQQDKFPPWYKPELETGLYHKWEVEPPEKQEDHTHKCSVCGKTNVGWGLWKSDLLPVCAGGENVI